MDVNFITMALPQKNALSTLNIVRIYFPSFFLFFFHYTVECYSFKCIWLLFRKEMVYFFVFLYADTDDKENAISHDRCD